MTLLCNTAHYLRGVTHRFATTYSSAFVEISGRDDQSCWRDFSIDLWWHRRKHFIRGRGEDMIELDSIEID
jgi:hypothetical protein